MKEIKAYIRVHMLDKVIRALEGEGFTDMTVIDVKAIRHGLRDEDLEYSLELASRYMNVAKLAIVVRDRDVGSVVQIIRDHAHTGHKGDGLIYVCPVEDGVHVRTGARGEGAVGSTDDRSA